MVEYSATDEVSMRYRLDGGDWVVQPLTDQGGQVYRGEIPGQPGGTQIEYYIYGRDAGGLEGTDPPDAPAATYLFYVMDPYFADDMESGPGGWTHRAITHGYIDEWHMSTQRNHTPGGGTSWKFGDTGDGPYSQHADGALATEPIEVDGQVSLKFWHWIFCAIAWPDPYSFHGGLVEMSVDGGAWTQISPVGGYPRMTLWFSEDVGSPFPNYTPVFGGLGERWLEEEFRVGAMSGTVQFRFRFGSDDYADPYEGWYIDDVQLVCSGCNVAEVHDLELRPTRVALQQNQPNPFRPGERGTRIGFDLPRSTDVQLRILDVGGRVVRTLVDARLPVGRHERIWDGRTDAGHPADCGVYFYHLNTGERSVARRMLVLR